MALLPGAAGSKSSPEYPGFDPAARKVFMSLECWEAAKVEDKMVSTAKPAMILVATVADARIFSRPVGFPRRLAAFQYCPVIIVSAGSKRYKDFTKPRIRHGANPKV